MASITSIAPNYYETLSDKEKQVILKEVKTYECIKIVPADNENDTVIIEKCTKTIFYKLLKQRTYS